MSDKRAVHAYISEKAERALVFTTDATGASKTGLIEAWLEDIHDQLESYGWDDESVEDVVGLELIRSARKVDARKRKRTRS